MDWSTNNTEKKNHHHAAAVGPVHSGHTQKSWAAFRGLRLASVALLFSTTILVIALLGSVVIGTNAEEGKYVDTNKVQAVYMDNDEVYYGRITSISGSYVRLSNVHYLRDKQGSPNSQSGDVLEKLGCDLVPRPTEEVLINRDHVSFWENSKDTGNGDTVAAAIKKYLAADPESHNCHALSEDEAVTEAAPAPSTTTNPPATSATPAPSTTTTPSTNPNTTPNSSNPTIR